VVIDFEQEVLAASYSRDILLSMISDVNAGDGIYRFTEGEKTIIGINASVINTGALNIGGSSDKDYKDAIFYANVSTP
jgi:hypothetical protein